MKTKISLLCIACSGLINTQLQGQNILLHPAVTSMYPVGSVADSLVVFGFVGNPAIAVQNKRNFIALYHQRPYFIEGVNNIIAAATFSGIMSDSKLGICFARNTFSGYHQSEGMLSYAQSLNKEIALGIQLGARVVHYPETKNILMPFGKIGMQIRPRPTYTIGIFLAQYADFSSSRNKLYLPTSIQAGLGLNITRDFFAAVDFRQSVGVDPELIIFMRYQLHKLVAVHWGMSLLQGKADAAVTFQLHRINLGLSSAYHPQLGISPGLNISYAINN
jgi:hypothetical protein